MEATHFGSAAGKGEVTPAEKSEASAGGIRTQDLDVLDHLMAGGQLLAAQQVSKSDWSPEKKLAGAVLASALVEIRDHHDNPAYRRRIVEDTDWIESNDQEWPFSFDRLCALFDLEADWVREMVSGWLNTPRDLRRRTGCPYRQAA
jgi:hypothetical protein